MKTKLYRTIILPYVLYGCETGLLTLREEGKPEVLESRRLRRIYGPKRDKVTENGEDYIMRSLMICTQMIKRKRGAEHVAHVGRGEEHIEF